VFEQPADLVEAGDKVFQELFSRPLKADVLFQKAPDGFRVICSLSDPFQDDSSQVLHESSCLPFRALPGSSSDGLVRHKPQERNNVKEDLPTPVPHPPLQLRIVDAPRHARLNRYTR